MTMGVNCLCDGRPDVRCEPGHCDLATGPGAPGDRDQCGVCWRRLGKRSQTLARFAPPPCVHLGAPTGERADCKGCGMRGRTAEVTGCAKYGRCTTLFSADLDGVGRLACCKGCPDYKAARPTAAQIVVTADGVGDHLLGLAAAAAWRRDNPASHLTFVAKPRQAPWTRLFDAYDVLLDSPSPDLPLACDLSSRGGLHYAEAVQNLPLAPPTARPLPGEATDWAARYAGCVVLAPGAGYRRPGAPEWAVNNRVWLPSHWLALERLLIRSGRRAVAIDSDPGRVREFGEPLAGLPPERVAALMKAASVVVSNESGMAHLAGALGVPCVVLSGPLDARKIHRVWGSRVIQGPLSCSGCRWAGSNYRPHCDTLCASLQAIQPEQVMSAVTEISPHAERLAEMLARVDGAAWHGGRRRIFREALGRLDRRRPPRPLVVETGCQRQEDDVGAGMSTTLFGLWAKLNGGRVVSIDNDRPHVELARKVSEGLPVDVRHGDSRIHMLSWEGPPIDLLYLDSLDTYQPGHAEHCLAEVEAALPELAPDALVLIDDTWNDAGAWQGKGALAVPRLLADGWRLVSMGYQCLLERSAAGGG